MRTKLLLLGLLICGFVFGQSTVNIRGKSRIVYNGDTCDSYFSGDTLIIISPTNPTLRLSFTLIKVNNLNVNGNFNMKDSTVTGFYSGVIPDTNEVNRRIAIYALSDTSEYTFTNGLTNTGGVVTLGGNFEDEDLTIQSDSGKEFYVATTNATASTSVTLDTNIIGFSIQRNSPVATFASFNMYHELNSRPYIDLTVTGKSDLNNSELEMDSSGLFYNNLDTSLFGNNHLIPKGYLNFKLANLPASGSGDSIDSTTYVSNLKMNTDPQRAVVWDSANNKFGYINTPEINLGQSYNAYSAGTNYTMTNTSALIDFGTTDPSITILEAGTYEILWGIYTVTSGATFAAVQTLDCKVRRINNTAVDLQAAGTINIPIMTTLTTNIGMSLCQAFTYTTTNTNDNLQIFGNISTAPAAGSVEVQTAYIRARRIQ